MNRVKDLRTPSVDPSGPPPEAKAASSGSVELRLRAFLAANPSAVTDLRASDIANRIGCSTRRVQELLPPGYAQVRFERRLRRFLDEHPEAVNRPARGGLSFKDIARGSNLTVRTVARLWRQLDLPDRDAQKLTPKEVWRRSYERRKAQHQEACEAWRRRNPESARLIQTEASKRWRAKVIRIETCVICGSSLDWTNQREANHRFRGGLVVCSPRCSRTSAAARLREQADDAPPEPPRHVRRRS